MEMIHPCKHVTCTLEAGEGSDRGLFCGAGSSSALSLGEGKGDPSKAAHADAAADSALCGEESRAVLKALQGNTGINCQKLMRWHCSPINSVPFHHQQAWNEPGRCLYLFRVEDAGSEGSDGTAV